MSGKTPDKRTPPDGGYGWVIVVASFIAHTIQFGITWTVGIFYVVFLETIDASTPAIALVSALNTAAFLIAGPVSGMLTNSFGYRSVTIVGGIIASLGLFLSVFSTSVYHFYCTFSVLTGLGISLTYIPTISIVPVYFDKKRTVALGLAVSGVGLGTFVFTILIQFLIEKYGWRSALLLLSAICLHLCVCGAMYRPLNDDVRTKELNASKQSKPKRFRRPDFKLAIFKSPRYVILCLNIALFMFGVSVVYVHLPEYAVTLGFTHSQGAWLFSVVGLANFFGRIAFGFSGHIPRLSTILQYLIGFFLTGVVTLLVPVATTLPLLMLSAAAFGFLSATLGTLFPEVLLTTLAPENLPYGFGYVMVFGGVANLSGPPAAALVYVRTGMYQTSFYLGGLAMISSVVFVVPLWWRSQHGAVSHPDMPRIEEEVVTRNRSMETIEEYI